VHDRTTDRFGARGQCAVGDVVQAVQCGANCRDADDYRCRRGGCRRKARAFGERRGAHARPQHLCPDCCFGHCGYSGADGFTGTESGEGRRALEQDARSLCRSRAGHGAAFEDLGGCGCPLAESSRTDAQLAVLLSHLGVVVEEFLVFVAHLDVPPSGYV